MALRGRPAEQLPAPLPRRVGNPTRRVGFRDVTACPAPGAAREAAACGLVLARQPGAAVDRPYAIAGGSGEAGLRSRVRKLQHLVDLGAEVRVRRADVADDAAMRAAVAELQHRFGGVDGVFHCAHGQNRGPLLLKQPDPEGGEFRAKVHGLRTLERVLPLADLDIVLLSSSISALAPGAGDTEYGAVNACVDAFAAAWMANGIPALAVNWERWRGVGMAVAYEALYREKLGAAPTGGMRPDQGADAFLRMLARPEAGQYALSTIPIEAMMRGVDRTADTTDTANAAASSSTGGAHARPALATAYVAPRTPAEEAIAAVWQEVLGIAPIGADDSFHDLGGDSLIAIKAVARLRERFGTELNVRLFYATPTVAGLAAALVSGEAETADEEMEEGVL